MNETKSDDVRKAEIKKDNITSVKQKMAYGYSMYPNIPESTYRSIVDYVLYGYSGGGFVDRVMKRDLDAVGHADLRNQRAIVDIYKFVWNYIPSMAWGSVEKFEEWEGIANQEIVLR